MSSEAKVPKGEKAKVFEMILSSPGMSETCKLTLTVSRQNVLLLGRLMEAGFFSEAKSFDDEILAALPKESLEEMRQLQEEMLRKSNLTAFYERLKSF